MFRWSISLLWCLTFRSVRKLTRPIGFMLADLTPRIGLSSSFVSVFDPRRTESSFVTILIPQKLDHRISSTSSFTSFQSIEDLLIIFDRPHHLCLFWSTRDLLIISDWIGLVLHVSFLSAMNYIINSCQPHRSHHFDPLRIESSNQPRHSRCSNPLRTRLN